VATADVVVRSPTGTRYLCAPEPDQGVWRCGRCEHGILIAPRLGSRCLVCEAEVIATHGGRSGLWFVLALLVALLLGWGALTWWR
jgi:hypothetical protein